MPLAIFLYYQLFLSLYSLMMAIIIPPSKILSVLLLVQMTYLIIDVATMFLYQFTFGSEY